MMNLMKNLAEVKGGVLEVNGDIFIVPNSFARCSSLTMHPEKRLAYLNAVLEASGMGQENDPIGMEYWIVSEDDLGTGNLADHGGDYIGEDGEVHHMGNIPSSLPASLFKGKAEGDVVDVTIPRGATRVNPDFDLVLHLNCVQSQYRYARFGSFDKVFEQLWNRVV